MPQAEQVNPEAVTNEPQPQADPGQIQGLVVGIQDGLFQLRELLDASPGIMPEDKQRLDGILSEYRGLITENLGAAPGEGQPEAASNSQMPIMAGAGEVKQAY